MPSIHKLSDRNMDGATIPMSQFEGKILCLVNVASACGYTKSNYEQLSQLYDEFPDKIEILAFPCNQFGAQEPVRICGSPWQHIPDVGGKRDSNIRTLTVCFVYCVGNARRNL